MLTEDFDAHRIVNPTQPAATNTTRKPTRISNQELYFLASNKGARSRKRLAAVLNALPYLPQQDAYPWQAGTFRNDIHTLYKLGCVNGRIQDFNGPKITGLSLEQAIQNPNDLDTKLPTR